MKTLLFIPYQDIYDFCETGILTREYAVLHMLLTRHPGFRLVCVGKPRTWLDKKSYDADANPFPEGSVEARVRDRINRSEKLRKLVPITPKLYQRRGWWADGYAATNKALRRLGIDWKQTLVYTNTPFAHKLAAKCKENGASILFDMMDNFTIYPSFRQRERKCAYEGYSKLTELSDYACVNSEYNVQFLRSNFGLEADLIKNGVFRTDTPVDSEAARKIREAKGKYDRCAGYIGKLCFRIDEKLLDKVTAACPKVLFAVVGPRIKGQENKELEKLLHLRENILYLGPVPSTQVYGIMNACDIMLIPHFVGKNENGGDPLKLYQYLNARKPVITTPFDGAEEFKDWITITEDPEQWARLINDPAFAQSAPREAPRSIYWEKRAEPMLSYLDQWLGGAPR
jgi:hypothetical protein